VCGATDKLDFSLPREAVSKLDTTTVLSVRPSVHPSVRESATLVHYAETAAE